MKVARMPFNRAMVENIGGLSIHLLKDILTLMPSDTKFVGCKYDSETACDVLFFTSDCFADMPDGYTAPNIYPHFRLFREVSGLETIKIEKIDFRLALPGHKMPDCGQLHIWQEYSGFTHSYKVCVTCGIKQ